MVFLRLHLLIAGLVCGGSLLLGLYYQDRRWFKFAWQLLKFSAILLLVIAVLLTLGRFVL